jgi:hypothetical protein
MKQEEIETVSEAPYDENGDVEDPRGLDGGDDGNVDDAGDLADEADGESADDPADPLPEVSV